MNKKITYSIVLCTYNREKHIKLCLDTLTNLDFPKDRHEVIVVDDGSTDSTVNIVKNYAQVTLVKHEKNKGIAAARNSGLKAAKGDVYICFDDDCFVDKEWLKNLDKAYQEIGIDNTIGIAGHIEQKARNGIVDKYVYETGYANPSPAYYGKSKNPIKRLFVYLKNMFSSNETPKKQIFEVGEIWGANCSFPMKILKSIDGWDEKLSWAEDTDLCDRIKKKYKEQKFYCTTNAILYHDHQLSLKDLLLKPYIRAHATLNFYNKNKKIPPIFPFPIGILGLSAILAVINPLAGLGGLVLLPFLFYSWWVIKAVKKKKLYFLLFSYLQEGYELATILGLLRGFIKNNLYFSPRRLLALLLIFSIEVNILIINNIDYFYLREILSTVYLLFTPGLLITWVIKPKFSGIWEFLAHSVGLSIVALMLIGLTTNFVLQPLMQLLFFIPSAAALSNIKPLEMLPMLLSIDIFLALFGFYAFIRNKTVEISDNTRLTFGTFLLGIIPTTFPILAIFGAFNLNNGNSNVLTVTMLGLIAGFVFLLTILRNKVKEGIYPYTLLMIAFSLLFMTSLRGWFITGHDIFLEYFVFQLTKAHGIWQMANFQDPYNACLSITILPTILANITHISDVYIYKALYQIIFSLSIVVSYLFIRKLLNPFLAFLATFVIASLPTFMTDMPMLNRQEIALFFFSLTLYSVFNKNLSKLQRWGLFILFGIGMLLSHYSTTYIAMGLFIGGFLLYLPFHIEKIHPKISSLAKKIDGKLGFTHVGQNLRIDAILTLLIVTVVWNTSITNTAKGITTTINNITKDLQTNHFAKSKSDPASYGLLNNGKKKSPQQLLDNYVVSMETFVRKFNDDSAFLSKSVYSLYPVTVGSQVKLPLTLIGNLLQQYGINSFNLNDSFKQAYAKVIQIFIVLGFLSIFFFKKHLKNFEKEYYILTITFFVILVFELVLPGGSIDYGILRLFQQGMILFSVPLIMGGLAIFSIFNVIHKSIKYYLLSLTFIFFFLYLSGIIPQITGGYYPQLNLADAGFYYDAYYTHVQDKVGMDWLSANRNVKTPVQSDWFTLKKIHTYEGFYSIEGLTPSVIRKNSYVYLSYSNLQTGQIILYINGAPMYYRYNFDVLNVNKNLVYSNGGAKVYR